MVIMNDAINGQKKKAMKNGEKHTEQESVFLYESQKER